MKNIFSFIPQFSLYFSRYVKDAPGGNDNGNDYMTDIIQCVGKSCTVNGLQIDGACQYDGKITIDAIQGSEGGVSVDVGYKKFTKTAKESSDLIKIS